MNRIIEKKFYWIGGSLVAFGGVALVRLLAPELIGLGRKIAMAAGYLLVIAGITIIAFATRRKDSEAFIVKKKRGNDSESEGEK